MGVVGTFLNLNYTLPALPSLPVEVFLHANPPPNKKNEQASKKKSCGVFLGGKVQLFSQQIVI